jgi:hypothetical protein
VVVRVQILALELPAISVEHTAKPLLESLDIVDRDAPGVACHASSTRLMAGKIEPRFLRPHKYEQGDHWIVRTATKLRDAAALMSSPT